MAKGSKKGWRAKGRRQGCRIIAPERHLIVSEGKRTEPLYFEGLREALKPEFRSRIRIVIKGTGMHTADLLDFAVGENRNAGGYDHVWVVYDKDDFDPSDFDRVREGCEALSEGEASFHALWSNPCVEVWFLLHFGFTTAPLESREAQARLNAAFKKEIGREYAKNDSQLFGALSGMLADAEANATRLDRWHDEQGRKRPSQKNPGTAFAEIIRMLEGYIQIGG